MRSPVLHSPQQLPSAGDEPHALVDDLHRVDPRQPAEMRQQLQLQPPPPLPDGKYYEPAVDNPAVYGRHTDAHYGAPQWQCADRQLAQGLGYPLGWEGNWQQYIGAPNMFQYQQQQQALLQQQAAMLQQQQQAIRYESAFTLAANFFFFLRGWGAPAFPGAGRGPGPLTETFVGRKTCSPGSGRVWAFEVGFVLVRPHLAPLPARGAAAVGGRAGHPGIDRGVPADREGVERTASSVRIREVPDRGRSDRAGLGAGRSEGEREAQGGALERGVEVDKTARQSGPRARQKPGGLSGSEIFPGELLRQRSAGAAGRLRQGLRLVRPGVEAEPRPLDVPNGGLLRNGRRDEAGPRAGGAVLSKVRGARGHRGDVQARDGLFFFF
ncbi:MAG: hypothetical protein BJ554DRAFT_1221 [Olpidium bornovanus]|uniref:Uncharacterized protein n=1 Tax=Olpidium bornovanus TaxID=278681 RepID=A0A8H7ZSG7_9FUNG|nr:MAG: hypothetical protein BJ554DRAFT_1221 [Olpidium bornovanus]